MTIDRARNSFAPAREWRAVLAQQGRVTLEADVNEQAAILADQARREAIDVIGPVGTPDGGYLVTAAGADVQVGPGTIYVGGWRLQSGQAVDTASQPGWLDMAPWPQPQGNQIVGLLVTGQSVVAVEDEALREVALGGPDTAGRLRLLQHLVRLPTTAGGCSDAAAGLPARLAGQGLTYDPATCELTSQATLQVTLVAAPTPAGPCDPPAQGGYLGADNQMIRVAVTGFDSATGRGTLVWGWNNAAFLYRAVIAQDTVVTLLSDPLDPDHTPQQGQAVEVLRCTLDLGDGDRSKPGGGNFVAAGAGEVMVLGAAPYTSATRQLTLPQGLGFNDAPRPVFVRLWQDQIPFSVNVATTLGDTGLAVTLADPPLAGGLGARPYWQFAVRPSTPVNVYPQRYLEAPQPPDGPAQYLAPLGVVGWLDGAFALIEDCSSPFLPLTRLHDCSCCSLVLDPDKNWLSTLNQAIADPNVTSLSVCFQPGVFQVAATIVITGKTVRMTGAGAGTQLTGAGLEVVLRFESCPGVDLSDLCVTAGAAGYSPRAGTAGLGGAVTLNGCSQADIEGVTLACASADLRAAACLTVVNPVPPVGSAPQQYNLRVINSQFTVGHFQVGILVINADRAQIQGNLVVTPPDPLPITFDNLGQHKAVALRLRRQLVQGLSVQNTAAPTTRRARAKLRKRQAAAKAEVSTPAETQVQTVAPVAQVIAPKLDLGALGRAHVRLSFGALKVEFLSSEKLTNAWSDALRASGLAENAALGAVHKAINTIASGVVFEPTKASPAFRNWLGAILPQLYSTSAQGIVVGGNIANDVRILDNTIDGTVQGIHVGLSDIKATGVRAGHLSATRIQIRGNTVNIRLTAETSGDRHGIFVGCAQSLLIVDNHLKLTRYPSARTVGLAIDAIKVAGVFGPFAVIERNCMLGFNQGVYADLDSSPPANGLWSNEENVLA